MTSSRANRRRAAVKQASVRSAAPRFNTDESPLGWLASRRDKDGQPLITMEQFQAGERLRRDFTFAHLGPRVTASWSPLPSERGRRGAADASDLADAVIEARSRVNRALSAVGPELSGILLDVCCFLKGLESCEKAAGWPQRSAKIVLSIGLLHLARHYGLLHAPASEAGGVRIRHWGAEGYRPVLDVDAGPPASTAQPAAMSAASARMR